MVLGALLLRSRPLPERGSLIVQTMGRAPRPRSWRLPAAVGLVAGAGAVLAADGSYRSAVLPSLFFGVIPLSLVVVTGSGGQILRTRVVWGRGVALRLAPG